MRSAMAPVMSATVMIANIPWYIAYTVCGMVGASGAISGVLGAYLVLLPRARVLVLFPIWIFWRVFYVPAMLMLVLWVGMQLLSGLAVLHVDVNGGVAFWAHVGGFVAGILLVPVFKKRGVRLFQ